MGKRKRAPKGGNDSCNRNVSRIRLGDSDNGIPSPGVISRAPSVNSSAVAAPDPNRPTTLPNRSTTLPVLYRSTTLLDTYRPTYTPLPSTHTTPILPITASPRRSSHDPTAVKAPDKTTTSPSINARILPITVSPRRSSHDPTAVKAPDRTTTSPSINARILPITVSPRRSSQDATAFKAPDNPPTLPSTNARARIVPITVSPRRSSHNPTPITAPNRPTTLPSTNARILPITVSPRRSSHDPTAVTVPDRPSTLASTTPTAPTSSKNLSSTNSVPATTNIEEIQPDGDLILNFCYCINQSLMQDLEAGSGKEGMGLPLLTNTVLTQPSLRLRVCSWVISRASTPLKVLLSDSVSATPRHDHPLVMIRPPRVWGFRESASTATVILNSDRCSFHSVEHALKILFLILHFKTASLHRAPEITTTVRVAELAWVFDCVGPILPWMQVWIGKHIQAGKWAQTTAIEPQGGQGRNPAPTNNPSMTIPPYTPQLAGRWMVVSWIVGDAKAFECSSRDYIYQDFQPRDVRNGFSGNKDSCRDLGVVAGLYADLCSSRHEFILGIYAVLNETYTELSCSTAAGNVSSGATGGSAIQGAGVNAHALILGSLIQGVIKIWGTSLPLEPTWNRPINALWRRVRQLVQVLEEQRARLQQQQQGDILNDPVSKFKRRMMDVFKELKGLHLKRYRPGVGQLMDFGTGFLL